MTPHSTAFAVCEACGGLGFQKSGDFANRSFAKCPKCGGLGQKYLDPAPERTKAEPLVA